MNNKLHNAALAILTAENHLGYLLRALERPYSPHAIGALLAAQRASDQAALDYQVVREEMRRDAEDKLAAAIHASSLAETVVSGKREQS